MRRISFAAFALASAAVCAAAAPDESTGPATSAGESAQSVETVVVTGSRIPRVSPEGPAPVVTISADDIRNSGFANISEVMSSLTQNLGALDNNQYTDGFSPGAQAVDLRGLGPNHTLVLVNGRRIADYPQSYNGSSNFTDISNIPTSLVDRVEILTGSASAIYGSDAISGVINFIMKKKADGTTVDVRVSDTQHGGGDSQRFQLSSGYSNDKFDSVFGIELYRQAPLWAFQRDNTNSRLDSPADPSDIYADPVFNRTDEDDNYLDPGKATCAALAAYDRNSIVYATRQDYGNYCGSYRDYAYATLENGRKQVSFYGQATYHLNERTDAFLDLQYGWTHQISYNSPLKWENSVKLNGDSSPIPFFNQATGMVEQWQRQYFTLEENGGLDPGEIHNIDHTLSVNTGIKGTFGASRWNYEGLFSHSQNNLESKEPALVSAAAQAFYLGPSLGVDPSSGYQIYNAPISRLYTPLTPAQFRSITNLSIDNDSSHTDNLQFTVTNPSLAALPAGPVGLAAVAEYGWQYYGLRPDPLSLDGTYYGLHNTGAVGSRKHGGAGVEFNVPVLETLTLTGAGRYDNYKYSSTSSGKFTYSAGIEYRPFRTLLIRGSYATGFRAPDLAYLYAGLSGSSSDGTDYYQCRKNEPDTGPDFFDNCSLGDVGFNGRSHGSTALRDENSKSYTAGFVFMPLKGLQITADYYQIRLADEVIYQSSDTILREEADCRLGQTEDGQPVDGNSAFCQQILSQVVRNSPTAAFHPFGITSVLVLPINASVERTSGVDANLNYLLNTDRFGSFDVSFGVTDVFTHSIKYFPGDPPDDELTDWFNYVIPKYKAKMTLSWSYEKFTATLYGTRLGGLPNYDGTERLPATSKFNGSMSYRFTPYAQLTFVIDNLFDQKPARDDTWTSFPYYSRNWFDSVGREFFVQFTYKLPVFGGH